MNGESQKRVGFLPTTPELFPHGRYPEGVSESHSQETDPQTTPVAPLDLHQDPIALTTALVDIPSVSHQEAPLADAIEQALRQLADQHAQNGSEQITVARHQNTVMAKTNGGRGSRVILAGHIDTVPIADNVPSHRITTDDGEDAIFGCGSVDMKSGDAVFLNAFATLVGTGELTRDITILMYEAEEVASKYNGLTLLADAAPQWLDGDVAILGEPSAAKIEAGCQGSIRIKVTAHGARAHSARSWLGDNAMHKLGAVIGRVAAYDAPEVNVDGLTYHDGLNVVVCESGVATNTIPDLAWMFVNYRFAPNRSVDEALSELYDILAVGTAENPAEGFELELDDVSPAAAPGLHEPAAAELVKATGGNVGPKFGWTDVARFSARGIPAVNFGPGDPALCHRRDEHCPLWMITTVSEQLRTYLTH